MGEESEFNIWLFLASISLGITAFWIKTSGTFLFIPIVVYIVLYKREILKSKWLPIYIIPLVISFLPFLPSSIKFHFSQYLGAPENVGALTPNELVCAPTSVNDWWTWLYPGHCFSVFRPFHPMATFLLWDTIGVVLLLIGIFYLLIKLIRSKEIKIKKEYVFILLVFVVYYFFNMISESRPYRFSLFSPMFAIIGGLVLTKFHKTIGIVFVIISLAISLYVISIYNFTVTKDVGEYINKVTKNGEDIIIGSTQMALGQYSGRTIQYLDSTENQLKLIQNGIADWVIVEQNYENLRDLTENFFDKHLIRN